MTDNRIILRNLNGGLYEPGVPLPATRWYRVHQIYKRELKNFGECSERRLACLAGISRQSAKKSIEAYQNGNILPSQTIRGHGHTGVGVLKGLLPAHHSYIYELYMANPAWPLDGYVEELFVKYGLVVNYELIRQ